MSDEMPNTTTLYRCNVPSLGRMMLFVEPLSGGFERAEYTRTDWLRSQIEALKVPVDHSTGVSGAITHNSALDQILNLLETGEKK